MSPAVSADQLRALRLRAQRIYRQPRDPTLDIPGIVRTTGGMQAQDAAAAALALRSRGAGFIAADVERARAEDRTLLRTWAMRGTLHLVATDDLRWLEPLIFPAEIANARRRREQLGLDDATSERGVRVLRDILADNGPATRGELRVSLGAHDIPVEGQALVHLLHFATMRGVICEGPRRGAEQTFVLRADWLDPPESLPTDEALLALTRQYVEAFGPARPEDFAAWSGLPISQARAGWRAVEPELLEIDALGQTHWMLKARAGWLDDTPDAASGARLLAAFDTCLMGYRGRDLIVAPEHASRVLPGGGMLRPTLLLDGRAAGTWKLVRRKTSADVVIEPFDALSEDALRGLADEAADVGRYLGTPTTLKATTS